MLSFRLAKQTGKNIADTTFKVTKALYVNFALVTGIVKGIMMTNNNRYLLVRHGDYQYLLDKCNQNILNKI